MNIVPLNYAPLCKLYLVAMSYYIKANIKKELVVHYSWHVYSESEYHVYFVPQRKRRTSVSKMYTFAALWHQRCSWCNSHHQFLPLCVSWSLVSSSTHTNIYCFSSFQHKYQRKHFRQTISRSLAVQINSWWWAVTKHI